MFCREATSGWLSGRMFLELDLPERLADRLRRRAQRPEPARREPARRTDGSGQPRERRHWTPSFRSAARSATIAGTEDRVLGARGVNCLEPVVEGRRVGGPHLVDASRLRVAAHDPGLSEEGLCVSYGADLAQLPHFDPVRRCFLYRTRNRPRLVVVLVPRRPCQFGQIHVAGRNDVLKRLPPLVSVFGQLFRGAYGNGGFGSPACFLRTPFAWLVVPAGMALKGVRVDDLPATSVRSLTVPRALRPEVRQ